MTRRAALLLFAVGILFAGAAAQQFNPNHYQEMRWRLIGPFRAGRTVAIDGIPNQPNVFYMAPNNGGVWKTDDYGRTWRPIFDKQSSGSIGSIAIAPSNPKVIYVGSGEGLRRPDLSVGDGMYKSTDGGENWTHLGLRDGQQFNTILVDPRNPDRVFVAVNGHPYGPNAERGIFRSLDGGKTWQKVLYKDENTGAADLAFAPGNPQKIYATLWASRRPPWSVGDPYGAAGSGLFVSTDGGTHWRQIGKGLPTWEQELGRIGLGMAPGDPNRMYAWVEARKGNGIYRSDDAGLTWTLVSSERRVTGRASDFACVRVDPRNKDVIYVANTSTYKSTDGGKTFTAWKGAPGGDDYHTIWINPLHPDIILLAVDQGATLTVNGGQTWSSWYNQPTAQFYHVITDNQFPYWVYGAQQESGSIGTASRSDYGEITFRDWHTVGVEEYGYVAPDPLDPHVIFGGKATRYDDRTHQTQDVSPEVVRTGKYRWVRTTPLIFSHVDPHTLYLGSNVLLKTTDGGKNWKAISPDLTRPDPGVPPSLGVFEQNDPDHGKHGGVIYSIGPSFRDANTIWIGTDDGFIQVTHDGGKTWSNVTPPDMTPWSKVAQIEASHFDDNTAYAAVNRLRLDDLRPYIYRTQDGGKTWQKIVAGLPDEPVNTVREDAVQKDLLFAGTERTVYVSFDGGDHWQSVQQNLPPTSIRDLVIHGDDVVVGTHGRSFWILDDITPLRQMSAGAWAGDAHLFAPQVAVRMRRSTNTDTPLPPETPAGQNPPDGAIIDYYLKSAPASLVVLEIDDAAGKPVRRYSSADNPAPYEPKDYDKPMYWARPLETLSAAPGMHRWVWDLHYAVPAVSDRDFPISAIPHDTPLSPRGPRAVPGQYTVKLTVDGRTLTQPLTLKMDPRVAATTADLEQQFAIETEMAGALQKDQAALQEVKSARAQIKTLLANPAAQSLAADLKALDQKLDALQESKVRGTQFGPAPPPSLSGLNGRLAAVYDAVDAADAAPTAAQQADAKLQQEILEQFLAQWQQLQTTDLAGINRQIEGAHLPPIAPKP